MLVPSTFTGWYRKMMKNAETASEMITSRSQPVRSVFARRGFGRKTDELSFGGRSIAVVRRVNFQYSFRSLPREMPKFGLIEEVH